MKHAKPLLLSALCAAFAAIAATDLSGIRRDHPPISW